MSLTINITSSIAAFEGALSEFKKSAIIQSTKKALNRSVIGARKESTNIINSEYSGLRKVEIKSEYIKIRKAKGNTLDTLEAVISYPAKSVSMIRMVSGSKSPRAQKGKKVKNRTAIKVQVKKGKRFILKKAFIARVGTSGGKEGNNHVFKRGKDGKIKKQALPSVGLMLEKKGLLNRIGQRGQELFEKNFASDMSFRMAKLRNKMDRAALR